MNFKDEIDKLCLSYGSIGARPVNRNNKDFKEAVKRRMDSENINKSTAESLVVLQMAIDKANSSTNNLN
jgi:hypothetical protein